MHKGGAWIFLAFLFTVLAFSGRLYAEVYCVQDAQELETALAEASQNGEDDEIRMTEGTFSGNFFYTPDGDSSLSIQGGFKEDCDPDTRSFNPGKTVLDGMDTGRVLTIGWGEDAGFSIDALTIENGRSTQDSGGGLRVDSHTGNISVTNCVIKNNTSTGAGGCVLDTGGEVNFSQNVVENNSGGYYGGGAAIFTAEKASVTGNRILGNTAQGAGGLWIGGEVEATLANNVICANECAWGGGGVFFDRNYENPEIPPEILLVNNTIAYNLAGTGGGVELVSDVPGSRAELINNIIYMNTLEDIRIHNLAQGSETPGEVILKNNDFDQSQDGFTITQALAEGIDSSNLNNIDPLFYDPVTRDYSLKKDSPVIDAGTDLFAPDHDIYGIARPKGDGVDMGAHEYEGAPQSGDDPGDDDDDGDDDTDEPGQSLEEEDEGTGDTNNCFVSSVSSGNPVNFLYALALFFLGWGLFAYHRKNN